ncbi:DUF2075 domain-containing protein [Bifidobacterium amazonense]|uniref:DUF2075 domain-containing protein n=1 Tax=Bifidobacterium amazonense TaxID=2809027 RepID=A0ABS9VYN6_9BIFI|nr:DUF2075 domain-containing protein [Bifidobacterium amazonense]MCH9277041.1 DUF2075 domain-containing protein [Bifidobacterium amazonense]
MNMKTDAPSLRIVNLPYGRHDQADFRHALELQLRESVAMPKSESLLDRFLLEQLVYLTEYPTVYVVYSDEKNRHSNHTEYTVYVGETNDIVHRTVQHLTIDPRTRTDWKAIADAVGNDPCAVRQYVISHPLFNKSLTLDIENRLMHYMSSAPSVKRLNNRRTNAQGKYYTSDRFDEIFTQIWLGLHRDDPELFPAEEIIRDSALFKASPFHRLSPEQMDAEEMILTRLTAVLAEKPDADNECGRHASRPKLIFVQGAAGTGKTVLLSHLFYRIRTELGTYAMRYPDMDEDADLLYSSGGRTGELSAFVLVNHKEQVHVYNQIATKLGLQKQSGEVVMLPTQFINRFSYKKEGSERRDPSKPNGHADIVLVDEAHLLATQGNQGYSGKNQLYDILRRAKIVVAVFDPDQILQTRQQWHPETMRMMGLTGGMSTDEKSDAMFHTVTYGKSEGLEPISIDVAHVRLDRQFRIAASDSMIRWINDFASGTALDRLPSDRRDPRTGQSYEVKVFDSPMALHEAIVDKAREESGGWNGVGLSRLLATYDWPYSSASKNKDDPHGYWNVALHRDESGTWQRGTAYEGTIAADEQFVLPWNYQLTDPDPGKLDKDLAWAEKPYTVDEVGSIFTIQGFDLNVAGVIIGPSVTYRDGRIVFDTSASRNYLATNKRKDFVGGHLGDCAESNLRHELNVLLKRGVHGLYLFAVDTALQRRLKECCAR